ncbi:NADPH oxidase 4-like [Macrobrachium nipponense]|uniref:NADPH oxidase 4-like n=1 Tax=Macrobrachium nipponense TaxID=159736 RepID=UPI0030C83DE9
MGSCVRKCRLLRLKLKKRWMTISWVTLCVGMFYIEYMRYKRDPKYYYLRRMLGVSMCISRGTAAVLNLSCCFIVIPMCRALAASISSAFQTFLSLFRSENKNRSPSLPMFLTNSFTQTAKSVHTLIAVTVIISSALHTVSRYYCKQYPEINLAAYRGQNPFYLFVATVPGITGIAMTAVLLALAFTSTQWARSKNYNAFFYTHHLGLLFLVLLLIHPLRGLLKEQKNINGHIPGCQMFESTGDEEGFPEPEPLEYYEVPSNDPSFNKFQAALYQKSNYYGNNIWNLTSREFESRVSAVNSTKGTSHDDAGRGSEVKLYVWRKTCNEPPVFQSIHSQTWVWISVAFLLWIADSVVRWWRQRAEVQIVSVVHYPCEVIQLTFKQSGFSCKPGQYVLLQCPTISRFEWHPFTVTCPPSEYADTFTILMRVRGDWSRRFSKHFPASESSSPLQCGQMPNDTDSPYCPVMTQSSLRNKKVNNNASQSVHRYLEHSQSIRGDYDCNPPNISSGPPTDPLYHVLSIRKSNSYSFSPRECSNKSLKLFNRAIFHNNRNCVHSEFLFSNILLLQGNRNSLPHNSELLSPHPNYIQENSEISDVCTYFSKSKLCSHSKGPCWGSGTTNNCRNSFIQNNNKLKQNGLGNDILCLCQEVCIPSGPHKCCLNTINNKSVREEQRDHVINFNASFYPRLCVDGPYNSPSEEMLHYPIIIGAAGGIGITPLAATLSHKLWHPTKWPNRIHMIWVVRDARLLLVIAPLLSSLLLHCWQTNMEDSIELRLHVTIPTSQEVLQDLFAENYPSLLPRISQGRPQWKHLFHEWCQSYRRKKVGVFTCGPPKLCSQVRRHCIQAVTKGANFNYHQESFS